MSHGYASVRGGKWHRTHNPSPSFTHDEQSVCGVKFQPVNVSPAGSPPEYIHESSRCKACEKAAGWETTMTIAEQMKAAITGPSPLITGYFGTGEKSPCIHAINGSAYQVAKFRDNSAIGVIFTTGTVYAVVENPSEDTLQLLAQVGRLLTGLDGATRVEQTRQSGTLLAVGDTMNGGCGHYFEIGKTVWHVKSDTECDFYCLRSEWKMPPNGRSLTEFDKPVRFMRCNCCGASTQGRQWWNRDTGYSVCLDCFARQSEKYGAADVIHGNGYPGIHHSIPSDRPSKSEIVKLAAAEAGLPVVDIAVLAGRTI